MTHSKILLSVFAFTLISPGGLGGIGWPQEPPQTSDPLQSQVPRELENPEKEMFLKKEQLLQELKESENKEERLQNRIQSQGHSKSPDLPPSGRGGGMRKGRGR